MIDWAPIKSGIKSLLVDLTGVTPRWNDEAEGGVWSGDPSLWLRLRALSEIGYEDERRSQPTATDDAIVNTTQQKTFTLSIRAESFSQDIADPRHAGAMLETIKTRLKRRSTAIRLAGLFSIATYQPTKFFNYRDADDRLLNVYVMDLNCATVDNDIDTTPGAGGWINEVTTVGTITDAGATPQTLNLDVKGQ